MEQRRYTVKEIAYLEGVSVNTVYRWCQNGLIPCMRRPSENGQGAVLINRFDYEEFKKKYKYLRYEKTLKKV